MQEFFTQHLGELITALIGAFSGWIFGRKKEKSELRSNEIDNAEKALRYYRQIIDDLAERLTQAIEELNEAKQELNQAKQVVRGLKAKEEALIRQLKRYEELFGKLMEQKDIQPLNDEAASAT